MSATSRAPWSHFLRIRVVGDGAPCGDYFPYMAGLRLFNGITNGIVFVLAPALVLEWLAVRNKATLSGLMYLGVGAGLLLSNQIVESTAIWLQGNDRWIPAAMISIPLALWSGIYLFRLSSGDAPVSRDDHSALWDKQSTPLFLSYFGAGLGYILPMTFLPAVAQEWSIDVTPSPWLIAARLWRFLSCQRVKWASGYVPH